MGSLKRKQIASVYSEIHQHMLNDRFEGVNLKNLKEIATHGNIRKGALPVVLTLFFII